MPRKAEKNIVKLVALLFSLIFKAEIWTWGRWRGKNDHFMILGMCHNILCESANQRCHIKKEKTEVITASTASILWTTIDSDIASYFHSALICCICWKNTETVTERLQHLGSEQHHVLQRHLVSFTYTGILRKLKTAVCIRTGSISYRWPWKTILL